MICALNAAWFIAGCSIGFVFGVLIGFAFFMHSEII